MPLGDHRNERRLKRHQRVRKNLKGSADRPRVAVFRSLKHIYAQLIDDEAGTVLTQASSLDPVLRQHGGGNIDGARRVGALLAERAKEKGVTEVVFDRGGYLYHGRVAALADAVREGGLKF